MEVFVLALSSIHVVLEVFVDHFAVSTLEVVHWSLSGRLAQALLDAILLQVALFCADVDASVYSPA